MACLICNENPARYKCPACRIFYCSVDCWKRHKEEPCRPSHDRGVKSDEMSVGTRQSYQYPTQHTVPRQHLAKLGCSKELESVLGNPHLRAMMTAIDASPDPAASIRAAMLEPIFVEFADIALKTTGL